MDMANAFPPENHMPNGKELDFTGEMNEVSAPEISKPNEKELELNGDALPTGAVFCSMVMH